MYLRTNSLHLAFLDSLFVGKKYINLKINSQSNKNHYGKKQLLIPFTSLGRKD
jgi:hypothetical protein